MTKRAAVYTRISRDRTGAGLGVDRQEDDCRELAEREGWRVVTVYRDNDLSAYSGKRRPGYAALMADIQAGRVEVVLAWHTDRLHRSPVELEQYISVCEAGGVPTVTVKAGPLDLATPSGRMVARQLSAVARYEVEHAIERQKRAKLQAAADGRFRGGRRPFGFEPDGVTVRPEEAAEILRATQEALAGASMRGLAAAWNARGVVTSTGRSWAPEGVKELLVRVRNAGLIEHEGQIVGPAVWPAIVPPDQWHAVRALLTDPSRRTNRSTVRRWLGSGLYRCGYCGETVKPFIVTARPGAKGRLKPQYVCRQAKHVARACEGVDAFVSGVIIERLARPDAVDLLASGVRHDTAALQASSLVLRERLNELASLYADGAIDARQLAEGSERLRRDLARVEGEIADTSRGSVLAGVAGVPDVGAVWAELDLDRRRAVIDTLITVTLHPSPKGRPPGWRPGDSYFRPETVQIEWKRASMERG